MKQIAIVSLQQNLSSYTNMLTALHCSFRIIRCTDSLSPLSDGLLLPGSRDCTPQLYGQKNNSSRSLCLEEDLLQLSAFDRYCHAGRPILGIGKGMHLINIAAGGSLRQHIGHYPHDAVRICSPLRTESFERFHETSISEGSMLEALYGTSLLVNSSHHQALDRIGSRLDCVQSAFDGCPEAVQHRSLPILGVQWHPERLLPIKDKTDCPSPLADGSLLFRLFLAFI